MSDNLKIAKQAKLKEIIDNIDRKFNERVKLEPFCSKEEEMKLIELVSDKRLDEIQEFLDKHEKQCRKLCFSYSQALPRALKQKQFKAYALLQSNFFKLSRDFYSLDDRFETLTVAEQAELVREIKQCFVKPDEFLESQENMSPLVRNLLLKTRLTSKFCYKELLQALRLKYEILEEMDDIRPIMTVMAASEGLEIIYDMIERCVCHVLPGKPITNAYCDFGAKWIVISVNYTETFHNGSSFVHESIHYLMFVLYANRGSPYLRTDADREEAYLKAFKSFEAASRSGKYEDLFYMQLFDCEMDKRLEIEHAKKCEGITYPVTAYLEFGNDDALIKRYEESMAELFEFYKKYTFPDIAGRAKEVEADQAKSSEPKKYSIHSSREK